MTSPFSSFANSTLRFQVSGTTTTADSSGNVRPTRAVIEVTALLKQVKPPRQENHPGTDVNQIYLKGYITNIQGFDSLALPSIVTPDSPCQITWQGRKGRFFMEFVARNPYLAALEIDLVERLQGYFQPSSFAIEADP